MPASTVVGENCVYISLETNILGCQTHAWYSHCKHCMLKIASWPCFGLVLLENRTAKQEGRAASWSSILCPHRYSLAFHVVALDQASRWWQDLLEVELLTSPCYVGTLAWLGEEKPSLISTAATFQGPVILERVVFHLFRLFFFIRKWRDETFKALPGLISRDDAISSHPPQGYSVSFPLEECCAGQYLAAHALWRTPLRSNYSKRKAQSGSYP